MDQSKTAYTEEEVKLFLKRQRKICADALCCMPETFLKRARENVNNASEPNIMNKEEVELKERESKITAFKNELKSLKEKYSFGRYVSHNYDAKEEYSGSDFYFVVNGETWYGQTIDEIINECIKP